MKLLSVVAALVAVSVCLGASVQDPKWQKFNDWKVKFGIHFNSQSENMYRFGIFSANMDLVNEHNEEYEQGIHTFKLGMNAFAHMTNEEFVAQRNGYISDIPARDPNHVVKEVDVSALPKSVDWRTKGLVTPVKDQGQCGSCWSFSTTGGLEGQHAKATGNLVSLSEEQLIDCDHRDKGCNGGLMPNAVAYLVKHGGSVSEADYPYTSKHRTNTRGTCRDQNMTIAATVNGYEEVEQYSETDLQAHVANMGPISVAIDASGYKFQMYESGVYYNPRCSENRLDHGVLCAGYGTEGGEDYWLVKNSWNTVWGEDGYVKMARNRNNNCGIATEAGVATV